ncbi:MAG TPA: VC0807 family protein, partial [Streptomyces sp.]
MSKSAGFLTPVLELVLSAGGYYLLRACGAGVFWALVGPAALVAVVAVAATVRRRRADLLGLLVLAEIAATLALSLVTQSPRVAALREVAYIGVAGVFCLATLLRAAPLTHQTAASVASFDD